MTDAARRERAKALFNKLRVVYDMDDFVDLKSANEAYDEDAAYIEKALAEAERAVWLKAALNAILNIEAFTSPQFRNELHRIKDFCIAQAEAQGQEEL